MALTDAQIRKHINKGEAQTIRDSHALFLRIGERGASWVCRQTRNGETRKATLGRYPAMTATVARRERDKLTGINTDLGLTVSEAVDEYRRLVSDKLKSGYQSEVYLRHLCSEYGSRKLATMTRSNLVQLIGIYAKERGERR